MVTDTIEPHFVFENNVKVLKCPKESCKSNNLRLTVVLSYKSEKKNVTAIFTKHQIFGPT